MSVQNIYIWLNDAIAILIRLLNKEQAYIEIPEPEPEPETSLLQL